MILPKEFKELALCSLGERFSDPLFAVLESDDSDLPNKAANISIRTNLRKLAYLRRLFPNSSIEQLLGFAPGALQPMNHCHSGYFLNERVNFTLSPLFHSGAYYVQDSSSMFIEHLRRRFEEILLSLGHSCARGPLKVLDLCAAPGGKSTHLISLISDICSDMGIDIPLVVCNEPVAKRTAILRENISRWGYENVAVTSLMPDRLKTYLQGILGKFDIILADVPCSGEGMFRKSTIAIEDWSIANVRRCANLQREIVTDIWDLLQNGGLFIYSTCTYNHFENGDNVEYIVDNLGGELLNEDLQDRVENTGAVPLHDREGSRLLGFQYIAGIAEGEGQFFSLIRKKGGSTKDISSRNGNLKTKRSTDLLKLFHKEIGEVKGKDVLPNHDFALSCNLLNILQQNRLANASSRQITIPFDSARGLSLKFSCLDIDYDIAIKYLKRESFGNEEFLYDVPTGYVLLIYKGLPLGFIKKMGSRANNLLPNNRRILSSF